MIDRRFFLKSSGLALVAGGLLPNVFVKMANAATTKGKKVLVAIFQRGAVDGLNVVVPYAEQAYYAARPTIAIPRDAVIDLDGFFGVHPSLASIVFMLGGPHKIGRKQIMSVFDPITRTVTRPELSIRAESLFTVIDSAALDETGTWTPAHRDTVRAWRVGGVPYGLTAWVDAEGRIVVAKAGTLSATRTAFELAFKNQQTK